MNEHLKNMLTGADNESIDVGRVLWALGALVFFAGAIALMFQGKFDMTTYGISLAAVLAGGGAALKVKESTEPKPQP